MLAIAVNIHYFLFNGLSRGLDRGSLCIKLSAKLCNWVLPKRRGSDPSLPPPREYPQGHTQGNPPPPRILAFVECKKEFVCYNYEYILVESHREKLGLSCEL